MPSSRRKTRTINIVSIMALGALALLYYLFPIWWESYEYENDQLRIELKDANNQSVKTSLAGTLVIYLKGRGMEACGWGHSATKNLTGFASEALVSMEVIEARFTDDAGFTDVSPYTGIGWGRRRIMGGCQNNLGFLLLISRPGYSLKKTTPRYDQINRSHQVLYPTSKARITGSAFKDTQSRLSNELRLLYPTPHLSSGTQKKEAKSLRFINALPRYWKHKLPSGQSIRGYALEILLSVNEGLNCPRIQNEIRRIFNNPAEHPITEAEILSEHQALLRTLSTLGKDGIESCS